MSTKDNYGYFFEMKQPGYVKSFMTLCMDRLINYTKHNLILLMHAHSLVCIRGLTQKETTYYTIQFYLDVKE